MDAVVALFGSELIVGGAFLVRSAGGPRRWSRDSIIGFAVAAAAMTLVTLAILYWLAARRSHWIIQL